MEKIVSNINKVLKKASPYLKKASPYLKKANKVAKYGSEALEIATSDNKPRAIVQSVAALGGSALLGMALGAAVGGPLGAIAGLFISSFIEDYLKSASGKMYDGLTSNWPQKLESNILRTIIRMSGGGSSWMESFPLQKYATGGILNRPHLGMVAEAGPEAIIPLSSRLRGRALDLWEEAGRYLGVRPYAMGGFAGPLPAYAGAGNGGYGDIKVTSVNNLQVGSEIDVGTLALQIGSNIARDIKQAWDCVKP